MSPIHCYLLGILTSAAALALIQAAARNGITRRLAEIRTTYDLAFRALAGAEAALADAKALVAECRAEASAEPPQRCNWFIGDEPECCQEHVGGDITAAKAPPCAQAIHGFDL